MIRDLVIGEGIRDWTVTYGAAAIVPYDDDLRLLPYDGSSGWGKYTWLTKRHSEGMISFNRLTRQQLGEPWWSWYRWIPERYRTPLSIPFASIATHNHFALDRGGSVFKQSAPAIKLSPQASEEDHLFIVGVLNSALACFWMKQVSYPKSTAAKDIDVERGKPESNRYDFSSTSLLSFPVPKVCDASRSKIVEISRRIEKLGGDLQSQMPDQVLIMWRTGKDGRALSDQFAAARIDYEATKRRMVALQEELDWEIYLAFSITGEGASDTVLNDTENGIEPGDRPFLWNENQVSVSLPESWRSVYLRRRNLIAIDSQIRLLETAVFKRPWWGRQGVYGQASRTYEEWIIDACRVCLLDRLESTFYWSDAKYPELILQSTSHLADKASGDHDFLQVAAIYRGRPDFDVASLVNELVESESVPFLPALRYKPTGLRKREVWERTWDLQRKQDAGQDVGDIPVPPKYTSADFLKQDYWRLRGKLDVPKERWISYPHLQTESDPSLVVGWAGWNHLQQATALVSYYDARRREGWDAKRLTPILAGLDQLLPWIHQWHHEIDPEFGDTAGQSYQTMLEHDAHELGLTIEEIRNWEPPKTTKKGTKPTRRSPGVKKS